MFPPTGSRLGTSAARARRKKSSTQDAKSGLTGESRKVNAQKTEGVLKGANSPIHKQTEPFTLGKLQTPESEKVIRDDLMLNNTACLTHGINVEYLFTAIENKELRSATRREGHLNAGNRDMDRRGGGNMAVYTRAVGTQQKAPAKGSGVGSSRGVQVILSPEILLKDHHEWRASTMDGEGRLPGVLKQDAKPSSSVKARQELWGKQSKSSRIDNFNSTVTNKEYLIDNEQCHYERVPLDEGYVKAFVCTSDDTFGALMNKNGSVITEAGKSGTIKIGEEKIPVLRLQRDESLIDALKKRKIANDEGQVR